MEENKKILTFLLAGGVVLILLVALSSGAYQGGDTFQHFMIAKWAFNHPFLFLDHWGKPFFTAVIAPFAQWGYTAVKIENTILGLISAWYTYLIARHLNHRLAWPAALMMICAPIYFVHLNSAMTEILFSTVIVVSTYWIMTERWYAGALLLSFLPFVRTEGFVLIPFISLWFLMRRQWIPFILLGFGTVVYSVLGYLFYFHDILWVFHKNPYEVNVDFYGSGNWHHFISTNYVTWGVPTFIALCAGTFWLLRTLKRHSGKLEISIKKEFWLVFLPAFIFLLFHSLAWWLGKLASVGEIRVLAALMPLYAVTANRGLNWMNERFLQDIKKRNRFISFYCIAILIMPFLFFPLPMRRMRGQAVMHDVTTWLTEHRAEFNRVWYSDPQIAFDTDSDPFVQGPIRPYFPNDSTPGQRLVSKDIYIWDAHFAANEGRTPIESFEDTTSFTLIKVFSPEKPFETFDHNNYEVKVYLRK
jgi:hypothetical protein